jgi:hypothetical protein
MASDERATPKYTAACDLAEEIFLPSHAMTLTDAEPARLYRALEDKGYHWGGSAWVGGDGA